MEHRIRRKIVHFVDQRFRYPLAELTGSKAGHGVIQDPNQGTLFRIIRLVLKYLTRRMLFYRRVTVRIGFHAQVHKTVRIQQHV
jgi:hypothetical protein